MRTENITGTSGEIELQNYENNLVKTWNITPNCTRVHIWSTLFNVENQDTFFINGNEGTVGGSGTGLPRDPDFSAPIIPKISNKV